MRRFDAPGRSVVRSTEAMAATSHPLATATAIDVLRRGGTAMDGAIAAAAVLAVVEPAETGIGGDCFALYAPNGRVPPLAFNGSGRAPAAAEIGWYQERGFAAIPNDSPHSVTVPGAVDAWCRLHERFGRLPFADLLQPAIRYAQSGYVVHDRVAYEWEIGVPRLRRDPAAASAFLPTGAAPKLGEVVRNPQLARSLSVIAENGRAGFYEGELAEAMVTHLGALGGLHSLADFAATEGEYVEPIAANHGPHRIFQLPPNTQGPIALLILKLLQRVGSSRFEFLSPEQMHVAIEAGRIAYAKRDMLLGDAARSRDLLNLLEDDSALDRLAAQIRPGRCNPALAPIEIAGANTVYLTVVDRDRNVASFINSIYHSFGSGICPPGTGILLQNRGVGFRVDPAHPNAIGPRRRPMHTIIPGMVGRDDRAELSFGVMGGDYQPMGHAHVLTAIFDHGLDIQAACDAPRYLPIHGRVDVEAGVDARTIATLRGWGHHVARAPDPLGGAQMIAVDWTSGTLAGASDPRKDGCALGY